MNNLTWLDLYNYLHAQANGLDNFGKFDWNEPVIIHDASTGDEYTCDTWEIKKHNDEQSKFVIMINMETIFR
jgi:hypothetical protein